MKKVASVSEAELEVMEGREALLVTIVHTRIIARLMMKILRSAKSARRQQQYLKIQLNLS